MNVDFRHIITLIIASLISFTANAYMSHPASSNFSDVFATTDRYQYSGKEFDRMNGLDLYDFHARQYDPVQHNIQSSKMPIVNAHINAAESAEYSVTNVYPDPINRLTDYNGVMSIYITITKRKTNRYCKD